MGARRRILGHHIHGWIGNISSFDGGNNERMMTRLYQSEYDECERILMATLHTSGIPKMMWANYVRMMADNMTCRILEEIHSEQLKQAANP